MRLSHVKIPSYNSAHNTHRIARTASLALHAPRNGITGIASGRVEKENVPSRAVVFEGSGLPGISAGTSFPKANLSPSPFPNLQPSHGISRI